MILIKKFIQENPYITISDLKSILGIDFEHDLFVWWMTHFDNDHFLIQNKIIYFRPNEVNKTNSIPEFVFGLIKEFKIRNPLKLFLKKRNTLEILSTKNFKKGIKYDLKFVPLRKFRRNSGPESVFTGLVYKSYKVDSKWILNYLIKSSEFLGKEFIYKTHTEKYQN